MPIKPENQHRYPDNWKTEIRPAILERAGNCCEWCGKPNGETLPVYIATERGPWWWFDARRMAWRDHKGIESGHRDDGQVVVDDGELPERDTRVVLTIAHLDHTPENNDPSNLRALCQRCHLAYDRGNKTTPVTEGGAL